MSSGSISKPRLDKNSNSKNNSSREAKGANTDQAVLKNIPPKDSHDPVKSVNFKNSSSNEGKGPSEVQQSSNLVSPKDDLDSNKKGVENKDVKAARVRDEVSKSEARELKSLREKCQKFRDKINDLELQLQNINEQKVNSNVNESVELNELREKYDSLQEENSSLKRLLKDIAEEKDNHDKEWFLLNITEDEIDSENKVEAVIKKINSVVKDPELKESLTKMLKKSILSEKSYRYVQKEWDASKQIIKNLKDNISTEESVLNSEVEADANIEKDEKCSMIKENTNKIVINGNALLKASIAQSDNVLRKISRKVTKDDVKSFVTDWSDKNIDGVVSMASLMLEEGQEFFSVLESNVESSIRKSLRNEQRMDFVSTDVSIPPPGFINYSISNQTFRGRGRSSAERPTQLFGPISDSSKDGLSSRGVRGGLRYGRERGVTARGSRGGFRGRGRVPNYRSPVSSRSPNYRSPVSDHMDEVRNNSRKTFTFTNKVRSDILEIPK